MFNGLTGYSTKPPAPIGLSVYPTTLRRRLLVSQVPRRNPSGPGGGTFRGRGPKGPSSAVSSGTPRNRAPAATLASPVNLRNTLRQQKDGTRLRGCHQLVRCLCVIRVPVIVAIFFKFRSFPILFEWIPIFHCLFC